jgi:hypothetical protein
MLKEAGASPDDFYPEPKCKKCFDTGIRYYRRKGLCYEKVCTFCNAQSKKQIKKVRESVGEYVMEVAKMCFQECPDDFCIQDDAGEVVIFGGTNRLIWSVFKGFSIDEGSCTKKFIDTAKDVLGLPKFKRRELGDPCPYELIMNRSFKVVGRNKEKDEQPSWCRGIAGRVAKKRVYTCAEDFHRYGPALIERYARMYDVEVYERVDGKWKMIYEW